MSRSHRKYPAIGTCVCDSEKKDKQIYNRRLRSINKQILNTTMDDTKLKDKKEISNVMEMSKDGRTVFNPDERPDLMRK